MADCSPQLEALGGPVLPCNTMNTTHPDHLRPVKEVAALIGRHPAYVRAAVRAGCPGACGLLSLSDLTAWLRANPDFTRRKAPLRRDIGRK